MIVTTYFSAILVLALWLPSRSNAPIIAFSALYGFGSGAFVSLAPALVAQISDIRKIGVRTGTLFAITSVAALIGNPIGGSLVTRDHGKFTQLQIFCGVMMMGGATIFLFARTNQVGFALKKKV
jgi:MFS family permease